MSLSRALVNDICIINNLFMVESTGVRGPTLARLAMVLVLFSIGNSPALRVITLHWEYSCSTSYELSLFEKEEYFHSTSHCSSRRKNTSTSRVITLRQGRILPLDESLLFEKEEYFHFTSHYSPSKETSALRVITLKSYRSKLYESLRFDLYLTINDSSTSHS